MYAHNGRIKGVLDTYNTRMPRPKRLQKPQKLTLLIEKKNRDKASRMADARGISIGRLFEQLILEADKPKAVAS